MNTGGVELNGISIPMLIQPMSLVNEREWVYVRVKQKAEALGIHIIFIPRANTQT